MSRGGDATYYLAADRQDRQIKLVIRRPRPLYVRLACLVGAVFITLPVLRAVINTSPVLIASPILVLIAFILAVVGVYGHQEVTVRPDMRESAVALALLDGKVQHHKKRVLMPPNDGRMLADALDAEEQVRSVAARKPSAPVFAPGIPAPPIASDAC